MDVFSGCQTLKIFQDEPWTKCLTCSSLRFTIQNTNRNHMKSETAITFVKIDSINPHFYVASVECPFQTTFCTQLSETRILGGTVRFPPEVWVSVFPAKKSLTWNIRYFSSCNFTLLHLQRDKKKTWFCIIIIYIIMKATQPGSQTDRLNYLIPLYPGKASCIYTYDSQGP